MSAEDEELDTIFSCQRSGLAFPSKAGKDIPILICLAGFPDTASVWTPLVHQPELQKTHHIIALGLPGMHLKELPSNKTWGYSVEDIQQALHRVVLYCQRNHPNNKPTIHLLAHDWGAIYCYIYLQEHMEEGLITKYAPLDIGLLKPKDMPLVGTLKMFGYMIWFALVFVVNRLVGSGLAVFLLKIYPWKAIGPLYDDERNLLLPQRPAQTPHVTYPYFQFLRNTSRFAVSLSKTKSVPQCFLYGTKKHIQYHSKVYLDRLSKMPRCRSEAIEGGHWFYTEERATSKVARALSKFFLCSS